MTVTTDDGFTIQVFSAMYLDWGLEISKEGKSLFYSPCALSNDSYGCHTTDDDDNELDEAIPWTNEEWTERLTEEADDLIEGFVMEKEQC